MRKTKELFDSIAQFVQVAGDFTGAFCLGPSKNGRSDVRAITRLMGMGAVIAGIIFASAIPAHAELDYFDDFPSTDYTKSANSCGLGDFASNGDNFFARDICTDGRGVRIEWRYEGASWGSQSVMNFTGGFTNFERGQLYNREMTENRWIYFRVGLVDNGSFVKDSWGVSEKAYTG